ncbi:ATP-binding protein [Actinoplanes sp. N902-109]|uniref:ATP-binding protein n=1 Tax=Actinoplanes sp. (strain N902-109) TaxID=649831 RepID=UPI0003295AC1|nr:ATP-binding protein [Actinoplanes sp. N902-109]AGL20741.1 stas domain-containing protein [Actinoplanes sp. N902-109]
MVSEVRHEVDHGQTYPVVRLTGVLDLATAPHVRSALREVLGSQPEAVVVDVRELALDRPEAAGVLADLAREAAEWPCARVVVCAAGDTRDWRLPGLSLWPTPEAAFAALGRPTPGRFLTEVLDPVVGAARRAREVVTEACARWELPGLAGPACIVITEMVNNVVAHARTDMTVLLGLHGGEMTVAVRDKSTVVPVFTGAPVPVTSYGGRGLLLIDSVASRWGSLALPGGKVVWAALDGQEDVPGNTREAGMAHPTLG